MLRRRLGIVFQDFRLLEDRPAEENVAFALEVTGARRSSIAARVMRVLTQVGLAAKAQAYPRELSGGEQQRVAIARALVNRSEEHTSELQSLAYLVCRLLLEKKKKKVNADPTRLSHSKRSRPVVRKSHTQ